MEEKKKKEDTAKKEERKEHKNIGEEVKKLKEKLEECQKKEKEYLSGWQRERADFLNYKKKELENLESIKETAEESVLLEFVKVFDSLERALQSMPLEIKGSEWGKGFSGIEKQFEEFLEKMNIQRIGKRGEKFDPNFHEAVMEEEKEGEESGLIVEVLESGYLKNGRVIKPAKVKVSK